MKRQQCPVDRLPLLVRDDLPPEESGQLLSHLVDCPSCQSDLETLAADATWWERTTRVFSGVSIDGRGQLPDPPASICGVEALCDAFPSHELLESKQPRMPELTPQGPTPWWLELLGYVMLVIVGVLLLIIVCVALYYLYRWLLSRPSVTQEKQNPLYLISLLFGHMQRLLRSMWAALLLKMTGYTNSAQLYAALIRWGRHSGLRHIPSETPAEYGLRLKHRFPLLEADIGTIINAFNREAYGL